MSNTTPAADPTSDGGLGPDPEVAAATASFRRAVVLLRTRLDDEGADHPDVGAAALAARAASGLDLQAWADMLRVPVGLIDDVEAGDIAEEDLPPRLRRRMRLLAAGFGDQT